MSTEAKEPGQRAYEAWAASARYPIEQWSQVVDWKRASWAAAEQACAVPVSEFAPGFPLPQTVVLRGTELQAALERTLHHSEGAKGEARTYGKLPTVDTFNITLDPVTGVFCQIDGGGQVAICTRAYYPNVPQKGERIGGGWTVDGRELAPSEAIGFDLMHEEKRFGCQRCASGRRCSEHQPGSPKGACNLGAARALAPVASPAAEAGKAQAEWEALLNAARMVITAHTCKHPDLSREEAESRAMRALIVAVDAFPHPCAAAALPPPPSAPEET